MFGYSVEELVDRLGPRELVHPADRAIVAENIHWRLEGETEEVRYQFRGLRKDGSSFPVEVHGRRIEHAGKTAVMGTALDNTERQRAEDELRESEAKSKEMQRIAHVGWWERDFRTNRVSLSDEVCRAFGVRPVDLPQWHQRWLELIHPEDRAKAAEAAAALLQRGPRYDIEYRVVRPEGAVRIVHSQGDVTWDESGRPLRQSGVLQDVTELRQAEREVRASETRFRTFVDEATDAFFLHDDQLRILDVNRQACVSLGYSREELIGMHPRDFDVGLDEASIEQLRRRISAGQTSTFETSHRRKDGAVFPVEIRAVQFEHGGRERRHLTLVRDISERKRNEEALRESEERFRALVQFSFDVYWETDEQHRFIRQEFPEAFPDAPLPGSEIGKTRWEVPLPYLAVPRFGSLRGLRLAAGSATSPTREFRCLTRQDASSATAASDGTSPSKSAPMMLNLILNAVEAMSGSEEPRELLIKTGRTEAGDALVAVRDTGPGLAPAVQENLFKAFYTTKPSGLGLGLSICRSIVEAHCGRLWASANAPRGAVFQFTLPAARPDAASRE